MVSENDLLEKIKSIVLGKEPTAKIYLYGSRAKGIARSDSDWDILILVNTAKLTTEIEKSITSPLYDLEFETGEVISPLIFSFGEWNSKYKITPLYTNIKREGRLL